MVKFPCTHLEFSDFKSPAHKRGSGGSLALSTTPCDMPEEGSLIDRVEKASCSLTRIHDSIPLQESFYTRHKLNSSVTLMKSCHDVVQGCTSSNSLQNREASRYRSLSSPVSPTLEPRIDTNSSSCDPSSQVSGMPQTNAFETVPTTKHDKRNKQPQSVIPDEDEILRRPLSNPRQRSRTAKGSKSQTRRHSFTRRASSVLLSVTQPMVPVVHIRIRPLLSCMGENSKNRKVWFLDHENMIVRLSSSSLFSSSASAQTKQEALLLPPSPLLSLNALPTIDTGNDLLMSNYFNAPPAYAKLDNSNLTARTEFQSGGLVSNNSINDHHICVSTVRPAPVIEFPSPPATDTLNHSTVLSSSLSLSHPSLVVRQVKSEQDGRSVSPHSVCANHPAQPNVSSIERPHHSAIPRQLSTRGSRTNQRKNRNACYGEKSRPVIHKKRDSSRTSKMRLPEENLGNDDSKHFQFEFIYDEAATQEEVFEESILPFADEALFARNISILCYGPTGSGKTYSMMGSDTSTLFGTREYCGRRWERRTSSHPSPSRPCPAGGRTYHRKGVAECHSSPTHEEEEQAICNPKERMADSGIGSIQRRESAAQPVRFSTLAVKPSNSSGVTDECASVCLSNEEDVDLDFFAHTCYDEQCHHGEPGANTSGSGSPSSSTCIAAGMGIFPRLVCVLLDRRGKTISFPKAHHDAIGTFDNRPFAMDPVVHTRVAPKPQLSERREATTLALTLRELTLYGIELYIDELYDLMDPGKRLVSNVSDTGGLVALCKRLDQVREDAAMTASRQHGRPCGRASGGGIPITSLRDLSRAYRLARRNRVMSVHAKNDTSSRSHAVFILQVRFSLCQDSRKADEENESSKVIGKAAQPNNVARENILEQDITSYVTMADLAGCERLKVTQVEGAALREAQYINKSLSALSSVVLSLYHQLKHVPYRNSKLTRLLRPCLEGGRVLVLVHVSPCSGPVTFNSLRFAEQIRHTYFQMHELSDASNKRALLGIFEEIIDPEQRRVGLAFQQVQKQYACLCAELRLLYLTWIDRMPTPVAMSATTTPFYSLNGVSMAENSLSLSLRIGQGLQTKRDSGSAAQLILPPFPSQNDLRFFRVYSLAQRRTATLLGGRKSPLRHSIAAIQEEYDRRVKLSRKALEQEISTLRVLIDELSKTNASLAWENVSPVLTDSYCEGLLKAIKNLTEECTELEKMTSGLSSYAAVLRQRLTAIDEIDHGIDLEKDEMGCSKLRTNATAPKHHTSDKRGPTNGSADLAPTVYQDPEIRDITHQQVMLARDLSLLRVEIACLELGNHIWQGLWARTMRQEILVAIKLELALMRGVLLDDVMLEEVFLDGALWKNCRQGCGEGIFPRKALPQSKVVHALARLRKRLSRYLCKDGPFEHHGINTAPFADAHENIPTPTCFSALQKDEPTTDAFLINQPSRPNPSELCRSNIVNPLECLYFQRKPCSFSAGSSAVHGMPIHQFVAVDRETSAHQNSTFECESRVDTVAAGSPLKLFDSYGDEKALQQVSVRKLLEEGIVCKAYSFDRSFHEVHEEHLSLKRSGSVARDPHGASYATPCATEVEGDRRDTSASMSTSTTTSWGLLKLTRHTHSRASRDAARVNSALHCATASADEANISYSLDFVYSDEGLPLAPRTAEVLGLSFGGRYKSSIEVLRPPPISSANTHAEAVKGLSARKSGHSTSRYLYQPTGGSGSSGSGAGGSSSPVGMLHRSPCSMTHEHYLFSIPLDSPQLLLNAHLLEAGTTCTNFGSPSHLDECEDFLDHTLKVALELNQLPLSEAVNSETRSVATLEKGIELAEANVSLGAAEYNVSERRAPSPLSPSAAKLPDPDNLDPPFSLSRRIELSDGHELFLPKTCLSSGRKRCTLLLCFPSPFYSNSTRLESAETIIAALSSLMLPPSPPHISEKDYQTGRTDGYVDEEALRSSASLSDDKGMELGGVGTMVCKYAHVPHTLLLLGKIQENDLPASMPITKVKVIRDSTSTTCRHQQASEEWGFSLSSSNYAQRRSNEHFGEPRKRSKKHPNLPLFNLPLREKVPARGAGLDVWLHFPESSSTAETMGDSAMRCLFSHSVACAFRVLQQLRCVILGGKSSHDPFSTPSDGRGRRAKDSHMVLLFWRLKSFRCKVRNLIKQQLYEAEDITHSTSAPLSMNSSHVREIQHSVRELLGFLGAPIASTVTNPTNSGNADLLSSATQSPPIVVPNYFLNSYIVPSCFVAQHEISVKLARQLGSLSVPWTIWQWSFRWSMFEHLYQDWDAVLQKSLDAGTLTASRFEAFRNAYRGTTTSIPIPCPIFGTIAATTTLRSSSTRSFASFHTSGRDPLSEEDVLGSDQDSFGIGLNESAIPTPSPARLQVWLPELRLSPAVSFVATKEKKYSIL